MDASMLLDSDDTFDDDILAQLDELESQHATQAQARAQAQPPPPSASQPAPSAAQPDDDEFEDYTFDFDESELELIDNATGPIHIPPKPPAPPVRTSSGTVQTTLTGEPFNANAANNRPKPMPKAGKFVKSKKWDHTAFAKSGRRKTKAKGSKGKSPSDGEEVEFEQFPSPFVPVGPPEPMKPQLDRLNARHWIFPLNREKRSYQFSIVEAALLENTLVALPTGLGKTFIASVIMLNYWRWFPTGKLIFMCPTKPLVAQQITACHEVCGIPGTEAAELHGEIPKEKRAKLWEKKRVFYMTPQTLDNDLKSENLDARDIVLLVVDEAHKATGEYAYATTVRRITAKNPHFRILALTATPSSDKDKMQPIIDALHISHIEIRSETSSDITPYIKKKERKEYILQMPPHLAKLRDAMAKIMLPMLKQFKNGEIRGTLDPLYIRPYSLKSALDALHGKPSPPPWVYATLSNLHSLSGAMSYFLEYSPQLALESLEARMSEVDSTGKAKKPPGYTQSHEYKQLIKDFRTEQERGRLVHPKLEKLRALLIDYFVQAMESDDPERKTSKAIVFVSFRACVEEIMEYLKADAPLINAARFIGQGEDKKGGKGMAQSEQLELIERFKAGEYNVLVSTSIGEEGLDIGEVDLIVCYETPSSSIRGLQRAGRTGRKRDGQLVLLMTENREEQNWHKAQEKYEEVQYAIRMAKYELYCDVPRLLPDDITPACVERAVECEPYVREVKRKRKSKADADGGDEAGEPAPATQTQKKKRNSDPTRNIPEGAATGFVTASSLRKKRKKSDEDDEGDADVRPRKRASKKAKAGEVLTFEQVMAEIEGDPPSKKATKKRASSKKKKDDNPPEELSYSQVLAEMDSGSDADALPPPPSRAKTKAKSSTATSKSKGAGSASTKSRSASIPADRSIVDLCDSPAIPPKPAPKPADKYKWILSSDDDSDVEVVATTKSTSAQPSAAFQSARTLSRAPEPTFGSDVEMVESTPAKATRPLSSSTVANSRPASPPPSSSFTFVKPAPPTAIPESPELLTQAIRPAGQARRRVLHIPDISFDSPDAGPISRLKRSTDLPSSSPIQPPPVRRKRTRVRADPARRAQRNELLDTVAVHSGDEGDPDAGDTSDSDAEESESDRLFVTELSATQADSSYDQDAAYRTSLFTQAPPGAHGPRFASGPARKNGHLNAREHENRMRRRAPGVSSSPVQDRTMSDYEMDSFVVRDDDPIIPDSSEP